MSWLKTKSAALFASVVTIAGFIAVAYYSDKPATPTAASVAASGYCDTYYLQHEPPKKALNIVRLQTLKDGRSLYAVRWRGEGECRAAPEKGVYIGSTAAEIRAHKELAELFKSYRPIDKMDAKQIEKLSPEEKAEAEKSITPMPAEGELIKWCCQ